MTAIGFERCGISGYASNLNVNGCQFSNGGINFTSGGLTVSGNTQFIDGYVYAVNGLEGKQINIIDCSFRIELWLC